MRPSIVRIIAAFSNAYVTNRRTRLTFPNGKTGYVVGLAYESGRTGMFNITLLGEEGICTFFYNAN